MYKLVGGTVVVIGLIGWKFLHKTNKQQDKNYPRHGTNPYCLIYGSYLNQHRLKHRPPSDIDVVYGGMSQEEASDLVRAFTKEQQLPLDLHRVDLLPDQDIVEVAVPWWNDRSEQAQFVYNPWNKLKVGQTMNRSIPSLIRLLANPNLTESIESGSGKMFITESYSNPPKPKIVNTLGSILDMSGATRLVIDPYIKDRDTDGYHFDSVYAMRKAVRDHLGEDEFKLQIAGSPSEKLLWNLYKNDPHPQDPKIMDRLRNGSNAGLATLTFSSGMVITAYGCQDAWTFDQMNDLLFPNNNEGPSQ